MAGRADRETVHSYRDLRVWKEAMDLAVECYRLTKTFPKEETFGLTSQSRKLGSREHRGRIRTRERGALRKFPS